MSQPFTRHVWSGRFLTLHGVPSGGNFVDFNDPNPIVNCTLLRTLIWVHFAGYQEYVTGGAGSLNRPIGFALGDINSQNFNGNEPSDDPGNPYVELIATSSGVMDYAPLSFPPDSTSHLTGAVNAISSDADIATTYNTNEFMYGNATLFVDSHAQRIFTSEPQYKLTLLSFSDFFSFSSDYDVWIQWRALYQQAA